MRGLKTMLFGIAVILCCGFTVAGYPYYSFLLWGMLLGLAICFVGLAMNDSDERDEIGSESSDEENGDEKDGEDEEDGEDDGENDEDDEIAQDAHYYSASRFPPM